MVRVDERWQIAISENAKVLVLRLIDWRERLYRVQWEAVSNDFSTFCDLYNTHVSEQCAPVALMYFLPRITAFAVLSVDQVHATHKPMLFSLGCHLIILNKNNTIFLRQQLS